MKRFMSANPFLCVGLIALAMFDLWILLGARLDDGWHVLLHRASFWLGRPIWFMASSINDLAPRLPDWLDNTLVVVTGLMPYALADWILRSSIRAGKSRNSTQPA